MKKGILFFCLIFLLVISFSCSKQEEISIIRLIDLLGADQVISSPLKKIKDDPAAFEKTNPGIYEVADRFVLQDEGAGENRFLIKKKMPLGLVEHNTLLAPPMSHFSFPLQIPEKARLEFTYGIRKDSFFEMESTPGRKVRFLVTLRIEGETVVLMNKLIQLTAGEDLAFDYQKIDLSPYGKRSAVLHFQTKGDEKAIACWFNPVIYKPRSSPRTVLLISLDTLRPDHLGCYGYERDTSPSIDRLAGDSVLFENCFASSPWTLPSHVSLLTALNCINHQVYQSDEKMDPAIPTLAEFLRNDGFSTAAFTGGGYVSAKYGFSQGFDSYHMRGRIQSPDSAEVIAGAALNWMERHQDRDFFLFLHTYQIHNPYSSPAPFNRMFLEEDSPYDRIDMVPMGFNHEKRFMEVSPAERDNFISLYDGEIRYTDEAFIRPILEKLIELDRYSDSLIVLTSDHGEEFFEHGAWLHTHSVYNETIKIPLIIKFPDLENSGMKIDKFTRLVDIMPTILDVCRIRHQDVYMDGMGLEDLLRASLKGKPTQERSFLAELATDASGNHLPKKVAWNFDSKKLILNDDFTREFLDFFLFPPPARSQMELFDIQTDPLEKRDLSSLSPEQTRQLIELFLASYIQQRQVSSGRVEKDERIEEQLRALGYIR